MVSAESSFQVSTLPGPGRVVGGALGTIQQRSFLVFSKGGHREQFRQGQGRPLLRCPSRVEKVIEKSGVAEGAAAE